MVKSDLQKKTILVTGGAGFIGTNFIYHALDASFQCRIVNLDALLCGGNASNLDRLPDPARSRYRFVRGKVQDGALLDRLFAEEQFAGVFHFAAQTHVDRSITDPGDFVESNVVGTFRLLDTCLKYWRRGALDPDFRMVHVSTDEVYGSLGSEGRFSETSPYDPSSPYSASKAGSDHLVKSYVRTYGLPAMVTNCSNNFGPYQYPEKLIPLMIASILNEEPLPVYGDGKNVRDWLYVLDHCEALMRVFEAGRPGESYNIGGGQEYENIELVHMLCDLVDTRLGRPEAQSRRLVRFVTDRPGHDRRYAIDASKIKHALDWSPRHDFTRALDQTVTWYLSNRQWLTGGKQDQ
ncbi:dTDP-glucose 4,6-dehydratase [Desulfosudis oleivorans]|uniref:dTDP-glucose 4,6-dehydratase n=1 Tax=Desulfosudis oleivorans (strain DSM 6200 / JCM 39069 / Hxd3) TaxID=96561 RepID=A8ZWW4_DESOH|nr:dTDP-glucose 4,6-dehydratase [Desulfosudis oleivorans]ABW66820.1 dTDP-glucose 4,6-dehydratase [Desulfosudis oleivorans Hxd3]